MTDSIRVPLGDLRALAEKATVQQVHPANWSHWVRLVVMAGPARDFIEAASPSVVTDLVDALDAATARALAAEEALASIAKLHQADPDGGMGYRDDVGYGSIDPACQTCGTSDEYAVPWPCATYRAANRTASGDEG